MGVAFGQMRQVVRRCRPLSRRGFSLVEILVVVGIVVVLATMLLPVLNNVRESANRIKCGSNLREVGKAARAFAKDHDGYFPMCYRMRDTTSASYPYYVPFAISQGEQRQGVADSNSNDTNPNMWRVYGTSWTAWQQYGGNAGVFTCPSALGNGAVVANLNSSNPEFGDLVWTDYMYVGGLWSLLTPSGSIISNLTGNINASLYSPPIPAYTMHSVAHWGTAVPGVRADEGPGQKGGRTPDGMGGVTNVTVQVTTSVLAADVVMFSGGPQYKWSMAGVYRINHMQRGRPSMPDFQNVLYSDGSVAAHGREDWFQPLNIDPIGSQGNGTALDTGPNWSMLVSNDGGSGGYLYWGELEALPPPIPPPPLPATEPGGGWPNPPPPPPDPRLNPLPPPPSPNVLPLQPVFINQ